MSEITKACSIFYKYSEFYLTNLPFSSSQILLEPGVIQDVLAAGSHLQLLELLSLCSHYLIQVRLLSLIISHLCLVNFCFKSNFSRRVLVQYLG